MPRLSASNVDRAIQCLGSAVFATAETAGGEAADRGTALHDFATASVAGTTPKPVPKEYEKEAGRMKLNKLQEKLQSGHCENPAVAIGELAMVYHSDSDTVTSLGVNIGRDYGLWGARDVCVTSDLYSVKDKIARIVEIKTGMPVEPAATNWQLRTQAVAISRSEPIDSVMAYIAYLQDDGDWYFDEVMWSDMEIDSFADELRQLTERIEKAEGKLEVSVFEGDHCRYCKSIMSCPAKKNLIRSLPINPAVKPRPAEALSPVEAGEVYEAIVRYEQLFKKMKKDIEQIAHHVEIPLPTGKTLKVVTINKETVNGDRAKPILEKHFGANAPLEIKTSKEAIMDAVRSIALGDEKGIAKSIFDELRSAGAITTSSYQFVQAKK